jgi:hypothetical protein
MDVISSFLSTLGGFVVFAGAYYVHQKVRLTRTACIVAAIGGFMTYNTSTGTWLNGYAKQVLLIAGVLVFVGICVIIADVKGKKKGADRPALFAFFLVPVFFVAFLAALPTVLSQAGGGVSKTGDQVQQQTAK